MAMKTQAYQEYTDEDQKVWEMLFSQQMRVLTGKACTAYFQCLKLLVNSFHAQKIPDFNQLDRDLYSATGWTIEVVDGLIPVDEFFELLSHKRFCSSTWLRTKDQLDYLEEPDMFHDIFGHIPLLANKDYSDFIQKFGEIGFAARKDPDYVRQLQRLYWYTVEFGLIREKGQRKIFGAGILSSSKESKHIYKDPITVYPYDIHRIMATEFKIDDIQTHYFEIDSYKQLYRSLAMIA